MKINLKFFQALIQIFVSLILLISIYGVLFKSANHVYFSSGGDGIKSTFGSVYHMKYDTLYNYTSSMNYPFGESVFYTGCQPLIVNTLKFFKELGYDTSDNILGILNIWMLLSIVIGSFFIYLTLIKLKLPFLYSLIVSNIIIFLSPQLGRFGGHYDLSYLYFIPVFLYFLIEFYQTKKVLFSIFIGLLSLIALGTSAYLFAFFIFFSFFFFLLLWFTEKKEFRKPNFILLNFFVQIVLPFIIFILIVRDFSNDRTDFPWGFFDTRAYPEGVFLPVGKPYGQFLKFSYIKWEGKAFIGLVSSVVFFTLVFKYISDNIKKGFTTGWFYIIEDKFLNSILWASIFALFVSFGWPLIWGIESLLNYTGPFKQFRAIGRFNWLFFYTINIVTYYLIWKYHEKNKSHFTIFILILSIGWGAYDAYSFAKDRGKWLNHRVEDLDDSKNESPQNNWINRIEKEKYQAILPLPYFHVGSEVYWISNGSEIEKNSFIVSMKTGLPLTSVLLSRSSISQTMINLDWFFEPNEEFSPIKYFSSNKDFLVIKQNSIVLTQNEQRIINYCSLLYETEKYNVYNLKIDSILRLHKNFHQNIYDYFLNDSLALVEQFQSNYSRFDFIYSSFGNYEPNPNHQLSSFEFDAKKRNTIIDTCLNNQVGRNSPFHLG